MAKVVLVAVDIRSTHNVGALFRTADGFSAGVILIGITPRPKGAEEDDRLPYITQKAHNAIAKTALGAEESVEWSYFKEFSEAYDYLRKNDFTICAIEQDEKSEDIKNLRSDKNTALILGPELDGLPKSILELCDKIYEIPMSGKKESFNVSVSAGIALYQSTMQLMLE